MSARSRATLAALILALAVTSAPARAQTRVGDLTVHAGDVPRRLVGYGIVTGLDGSGDRSFGFGTSGTPSVRSVVNLLRRFEIEVPPEQLRLRDVAAVLVTAEVSPWLRAGGRFEVQVSALGDATSLRGGVLWMTPLTSAPNEPAVATAQGPVRVTGADDRTFIPRVGNSGRIPEGGLLEVDPPAAAPLSTKLVLRHPDLAAAQRIVEAVNAAFGAGTAKLEDPGSVLLAAAGERAAAPATFLAAVDTVVVTTRPAARVVIDARAGTVVAGGAVRVGPAVVSHGGITLQVGGGAGATAEGLVRVESQASVQDVAAGLHAAGARPQEIAAMFEALQAAGALTAEVIVR